MTNIYTDNSLKNNNFKPKKETLKFLFNYSKSLKIIAINNNNFKLFLN